MLDKDLLNKIETFAEENNEAITEINNSIIQINECLSKVNPVYIADQGILMLDEEVKITKQEADVTKTFIKKMDKLGLKLSDVTFHKNTIKRLVWDRIGWNEIENKGIYSMAVASEEHTYGKSKDTEIRIPLRDHNWSSTPLRGNLGAWHDHIKKLAAPFFNDFMKAMLSSIQKKSNNVN